MEPTTASPNQHHHRKRLLARLREVPRLVIQDLIVLAAAGWLLTKAGVTVPEGVLKDAFGSFLTHAVQKVGPYLGIPLAHALSRLLTARALRALLIGAVSIGVIAVIVRLGALPSLRAIVAGWYVVAATALAAGAVVIILFAVGPRLIASDSWLDQHIETWTLAGPLLKEELREHGPFYFGGPPQDPLESLSQDN